MLRDEFNAVFDCGDAAIALLDNRGVIVALNRRWAALASGGVPALDLAIGEPCSWAREATRDVLAGRRSHVTVDANVDDIGIVRRFRTTVDAAEGLLGAVVRCEDVSDEALMQLILRRQSDLIDAIDESLPVAMFERIAVGDEWDYRFSSDRFIEIFGVPPDRLWEKGGAWASLLHDDDRERVLESYAQAALAGGGTWHAEFRALTTRATYAWFRADVHVEVRQGRELRSFGLLQDVTAEKAALHRVDEVRTHDELTGLRTRACFEDEIASAINRWADATREFAVIELDIDDFREINVSHGLDAGDELLRRVANILKDLMSPTYEPCRVGGDTFGVIVEGASGEAALALAREVVERLSTVYVVNGKPVHVRVSAGVAVPGSVHFRTMDLLGEAELAHRAAYESGGRCAVLFSATMAEQTADRNTLKNELRDAIEREEFVLFYQPKVDLVSRRIVGCEALIRWNHPTRGLLVPGAFLGLAESSGLIVPIGAWVAREACRQSMRWRAAGLDPGPVAVNVSAVQLVRDDVFDLFSRVLAEEGAQSGSLDIELTESAFIHFSDDLVTMLERVRALGIAIALDDFGMGYSSLTYVRRLPLRAIKVDQTFVRGAVANAGDAAIVRWVARLGLELGLEVIAEGIETDRELELVLEAGCTRGQGYFFGRPVPAETFIELLKSNGTSTPRRARRLRLPTSRNG